MQTTTTTSTASQVYRPTEIPEPPLSRFLFADTRMAWFWLIVRLYAGYEWMTAGFEKLQNPAWAGGSAGGAMTGFVNGALQKSTGAHPDVTGWYGWFLQHLVLPNTMLWSNAISIGETLVGIGLIVGALTGVAAFFGALMNVNYLLAGTVSTNPILFVCATWLVLAWRVAGWWGLDRWLLPVFGTPWWSRRAVPAAREPALAGQPQRPAA